MKEVQLFTDGSVNVQSNIGYGAYLFIEDNKHSLEFLKNQVKVQRFENTSSTKLELQILLRALNEAQEIDVKLIIFTDSQNIIGLPGRRERFEKNSYRSKKNELIKNSKLYQEFYRLTDNLDCDFVKVRGHQQSHRKDDIHKVFTLVDKASRRALREEGANK